jgi:hypothetical protein
VRTRDAKTVIALFLLSGCSSTFDTQVVCPVHVHEWTKQEDVKAAEDMDNHMPYNSIVWSMLMDYDNMRKEARSCLSSN